MPSGRVFFGRCVFILNGDIHEVKPFFNDIKLKIGFAYMKDGLVYIYYGKLNKLNKDELKPGIYQEKGVYKFIKPSKKERSVYSTDNVTELNVDWMFDRVDENRDIEIINNNSDVYIPIIRENDDPLKIAIKKAIIEKRINLKNYKGKFLDNYALNNRKSGLNGPTKMSITNFKTWCEVLGLEWKLELSDNGTDKMNPMKNSILIDSNKV